MAKSFNLKAIINKANGQVNVNFPKKSLPKKFLDLIKKDPATARMLKVKLEGFK